MLRRRRLRRLPRLLRPRRGRGVRRRACAAKDLDVAVYPVPAYSTLGQLPSGDWLADPLLNTFIDYPEGELARLIFHELAHQVAFAPGDTLFNESFASAVEKIGAERWLGRARRTPQARAEYERAEARRADFRALTSRYRDELARSTRATRPTPPSARARRRCSARLRAEYAALKAARWGGYAGYDAWFARGQQCRRSACSPATPRWCRRSSACSSARAATSRASTPKSGASRRLPPAERRAALER